MSHFDRDNLSDMTLSELHEALQWIDTEAPSRTPEEQWTNTCYRIQICNQINKLAQKKFEEQEVIAMIKKAAVGLGVSPRNLALEIQHILSRTINMRSCRVTTALGITNSNIKDS